VAALIAALRAEYPFLTEYWAGRLVRAYGTEARAILGDARVAEDLGRDFGATLSEAEVRWLIAREFACTAEDIVWRRSKLGLRLDAGQIGELADYMAGATAAGPVRCVSPAAE